MNVQPLAQTPQVATQRLSNPNSTHPIKPSTSHRPDITSSWWLDVYTTAGRKSENQDSLLITTCLTGYFKQQRKHCDHVDTCGYDKNPVNKQSLPKHPSANQLSVNQLPMIAVLSDGVSACQFPKQASSIAVEMTVESIVTGLEDLYANAVVEESQFYQDAYTAIFDEDKVAAVIKAAVTKANDAMYFSQSYQRVPPLLATLSGVVCIGDRVHLFHTGDSRIYRIGAESLTALTEDHRIHHGQDKGALSAAIGADSRIELQQRTFTLHQNEYLALMTDGVYEFINPIELQFELSSAVAHLDNASEGNQLKLWQLSQHLCDLALSEGSNDNLSIVMLGIGSMPSVNSESLPFEFTPQSSHGIAKHSSTHATQLNLQTVLKDAQMNPDDVYNNKSMYVSQEESHSNGDQALLDSNQFQQGHQKSHDKRQLNGLDLPPPNNASALPTRYRLAAGLEIGDSIDGFTVVRIIARTARSDVYLVHDDAGYRYALKSPSLMTVDDGHYLRDFLKERKIGLSLSKHRRAGEKAYNQANPNLEAITQASFNNAQPHKDRDNKASKNKAAKEKAAKDKAPTINDSYKQSGINDSYKQSGSSMGESGLLRYFPVPASSTYLYHLTEFIEGDSLRVFMERNGPCDVWQTYDLLTKIGMAVRVMHRNYLLHQDIKPENILLTTSGAVKLIDFGSVASSILKDNTRPPVGDLHYAAPEYYTDAPKGVNSDLFSIAVIGFELLTGERPFTSQKLMNPQEALIVPKHLMQDKRVPATTQQALLRALHRNTNARHQAIGEFLQDFNPDNRASLSDPEPLIQRNPLLVWHGICLIQSIIIIFLLIKYLPTS